MEKDQPHLHRHYEKTPQTPTQKPEEEHEPSTLKPAANATATNTNTDSATATTIAAAARQRAIWDCGSALYDSFELTTFHRQLDSAIISSSRTFSMPRLPSQGGAAPPPPPLMKAAPSTKLSKSFRKLLKSINVFRHKPTYDSSPQFGSDFLDHPAPSLEPKPKPKPKPDLKPKEIDGGGKYYVVYEKVNALSTAPEVPVAKCSKEIGSLVRRTTSDRFRSSSVSVYCR